MSLSWSGGKSRSLARRGRERREQDPEKRLQADLLRYLKIRERSCWEVRSYLKRRGHRADLIEQAVIEASEIGYIDDTRFAAMYLRDRRRLRPMSRAAVLREMKQKGIDSEVALEALEIADPAWEDHESAWDAVSRRWNKWRAAERRKKAAGFLKRRGFNGGVIWAVIERLESKDIADQDTDSDETMDPVSFDSESEPLKDGYSDEVE